MIAVLNFPKISNKIWSFWKTITSNAFNKVDAVRIF